MLVLHNNEAVDRIDTGVAEPVRLNLLDVSEKLGICARFAAGRRVHVPVADWWTGAPDARRWKPSPAALDPIPA